MIHKIEAEGVTFVVSEGNLWEINQPLISKLKR